MPTLDYIRIVGITDITPDSSAPYDITFNIEYSGDSDFSSPKMGVITLRMNELLDTSGLGAGDLENELLSIFAIGMGQNEIAVRSAQGFDCFLDFKIWQLDGIKFGFESCERSAVNGLSGRRKDPSNFSFNDIFFS